jgi:hypothetical protein
VDWIEWFVKMLVHKKETNYLSSLKMLLTIAFVYEAKDIFPFFCFPGTKNLSTTDQPGIKE